MIEEARLARRIALVALLGAGAVVAAGHGLAPARAGPAPAGQASPTPATDAPGRILYLRDCAWCHGDQGEGSIYGPALIGVGPASADFMLSTGRMPIADPRDQPERKPAIYGPETIAELVEYVASFGGGPAIPEVDAAAGALGRGATLYEEHCAACHSSTGVGAALTSGQLAPSVEGVTATQVAEAIRLGGAGLRTGNMPNFGPEVLDQDELNSVVRYVLYLGDPVDRGGEPLAHLGPVAEGFVALAGGLLVLLVFVRWIGRRTSPGDGG